VQSSNLHYKTFKQIFLLSWGLGGEGGGVKISLISFRSFHFDLLLYPRVLLLISSL